MNKMAVTLDDSTFTIDLDSIDPLAGGVSVCVDGEPLRVIIPHSHTAGGASNPATSTAHSQGHAEQLDWLIINDRPYEIVFDPEMHWLYWQGRTHQVSVRDLDASVMHLASQDGRIKAPIPGQITRVMVESGQHVTRGSTVLILEAMKMENHILAPVDGSVSLLGIAVGQTVMLNQVLAEIIPER